MPGIRYAGEAEAARLAKLILALASGETVPDEVWRWLHEVMNGVLVAGTTRAAGRNPPAPGALPAPADALMAELPTTRADPGPAISARVNEDTRPDQGYPLDAAGLVLIHPFVGELMKACGLLNENGSFRGDVERERGPLLLYLAATGNSAAAEPDLLLAKLFLGQDPGAAVPRSIEPSPGELHEIDGMLKSVITHWAALGNTSPAALRETFLARSGRLSRTGEDWRLRVEPRGVDVLIDRLPWAIGFALTPFMARPIRVEWR
jgi:hypothetical protein